ncbi:MAG: benzoyl-CoA reductase subunit D [Deltaproteobacteria bacterium]|nr:benzoyl-CoA reductase subunit D [Deltaproteobacteria bacterium]
MILTAGIDVGSAAVKVVVLRLEAQDDPHPEVLALARRRIRKREIFEVVDETFRAAVLEAKVDKLDYVATTGEGSEIPFATGHFYGMTTHARGALFLEPKARAVLDVGALHARAVTMDARGRVQGYKMTSQCASGSGQFLENIARYLGVTQADIGPLSLSSQKPEKISSICAVLAETDVINMVSRGISTADILRGIHESMSGRFAHLLRSLNVEGTVVVSGGLAADVGLVAAINADMKKEHRGVKRAVEVVAHPQSTFAGALGAAIWGGNRHAKVGGVAWTATATT